MERDKTLRILYLPNAYSQQRQKEKPANIYPVLMAMEAEWYRKQGHWVRWGREPFSNDPSYDLKNFDKVISKPEGIPFLSLPHPDRVFTEWWNYQNNGNFKYHPGTYMQVANGCWWGKCSFCVENQGYRVKESFTPLCCPNEFTVGQKLDINEQTSKNRLSINAYELIKGEQKIRGSHNVKKSTFFRCCENGKPYEVRSVGDCIEEIKEIKQLGFKEVFDDSGTFPTDKWLCEFMEKITPLRIHFSCNMRMCDMDYDALFRAGFRMLLFGLESANQETLDKINKGVKVEDYKYIIKAAKAGLEPHIACMIAFPWENYQDTMRTINLVKFLLRKGYAKTAQCSFYAPPKDQQQGNEEFRKYVNKFYEVGFDPRFWWNKIIDIHNVDDFKYLIRGLKEGWKGIKAAIYG